MYIAGLSRSQSVLLARTLSLLHALVPAGVGTALLVWATVWPRHIDRAPAGWGDMDGLAAFLGGVMALAWALPYAFLAIKIWRGRRWAMITWSCLAGLQGARQIIHLLGTIEPWNRVSVGVLVYSLLLLAAGLPWFSFPQIPYEQCEQRRRPCPTVTNH